MIWTYIRDFLVQYVFGGFDSNGIAYYTNCGQLYFNDGGNLEPDSDTLNDIIYKIGDGDVLQYYIGMADWLSTTATIIIMCLIVFLFVMLVRWVYKTVVSAFLLR